MNQNREVREQPQWVTDLLDKLDRLEARVFALECDKELLENLRYLRNFDYE